MKYRNREIKNLKMLRIRNAIPSDAPSIIDFQLRMAWETENMKLVPEIVTKGVDAVFNDPSRGRYYVAEAEGKVIASLLITNEWSDWRNCNVWWFQSVYVLPEFRRKGVFRIMYGHIRDRAVHEGIAGLRLYVETKNLKAQKTYEALGMSSEHYAFYEWMRE